MTGYSLSLPSKTLPLLPSPPACSFCDLRLPATSQRILPPFAETPPTSPFYSATSFASPNLRPRGLHPSASCPRLRLRYIFAPTLYPTSLLPSTLLRSHPEPYPGPSVSCHLAVRSEHVPFPPFRLVTAISTPFHRPFPFWFVT